LELLAVVGGCGVGVELEHPARGVDRSGDDALLGQLRGLAQVDQDHLAVLELARHLVGGEVLDPPLGLGHQRHHGLGVHRCLLPDTRVER